MIIIEVIKGERKMNITLGRIGTNKTLGYAAQELTRILKKMDPTLFVDTRIYDEIDPKLERILWLGLDGSVEKSGLDEIRIEIQNGAGIITGSSERAVLIGAYRFLFELGCRFLRPGAEGEEIPQKKLKKEDLCASVQEKASYRHRGVCIEGAVSYEHVRNMIDYLPKVGMNGYFMQFHIPTIFFTRFYNDPYSKKGLTPVTDQDVAHMWKGLEEEIVLRGLDYHATGHGWTCDPFGIPASGWTKMDPSQVPADAVQYLAEIDGKRALWRDVALNTNLCYSNPVVRDKMTSGIVEYCQKHSDVNFLHFWLADGKNNHCECPECQKKTPADFYVTMLNELDEKLTAAGVDTKIVCLIYVDLLWAPEQEKIKNPDRFVLMFAPITRTYTNAFSDVDPNKKVELTPYVRNQLKMPKAVEDNLARLERWQNEQINSDSFDFDYHLMWDHHLDPGYYECARILHKDMVNLDKIGLNGMMSCQLQRTFLPTGLPFYAMAKGLWDKKSQFSDICDEYFTAAFGEDAKVVEKYLSRLSVLFDPPYVRKEKELDPEGVEKRLTEAKEWVDAFSREHLATKGDTNPSWKLLVYHAELTKKFADAQMSYLCGKDNEEERLEKKTILKDAMYEMEDGIQEVFDPVVFQAVYRRTLRRFVPEGEK